MSKHHTYAETLDRVIREESAIPLPDTATLTECRKSICEITQELRRHLSNGERILLVAERSKLRKWIERLELAHFGLNP